MIRATAATTAVEAKSRAQCVCATAELAVILEPTVDIAIWQRRAPADLALLLERIDTAGLPNLYYDAIAVDAVVSTLRANLGTDWARLDTLTADIGSLARLYGSVMGRRVIRLRLERVTGDACSMFHVDRLRAPLLTTYLGPGTEWLEKGPDGSMHIRRFEPLAVGLLKGSLWPGSYGCAHRSPPIAGTGQHRLLLCIDEGLAG